MNRRTRAILLAGLALVLGAMAASDVAGREAALKRSIGRSVPVVVARLDIAAGARVSRRALAIRRVPARYAPPAGYSSVPEVGGLRAAVAIPAGTDLVPSLFSDGTNGATQAAGEVAAGERVADLIAHGSAELIRPGSRVDVLVTSEDADGQGTTTLALQNAEVLTAAPASAGTSRDNEGGPRVALSLRVTLRQAVKLAAAQNFAREIRVLARAPGDDRHAPRLSAGD